MKNMVRHDISKMSDLAALAHELAASLHGGEVLGLIGTLGAGKTTFVQLLAAELGVAVEVKSPTFVLVREYPTGQDAIRRGIRCLVHADAYRLEDEAELWGIGFDELASSPDAVTAVEWADRIPGLARYPSYRELRFGFDERGGRFVEVED
ncbi:tRNA (adenosine(37)-N6)-threonylcarbamoyltransferase complex ATPase subunit type 1 TsaE [Candidatus Uhrbacteria bacterium CG_4_10_14_0_8_um_filter_58_22]|uniref:tRNA threonylcarbamoyladenosine biosynthesis protein TsaE n=1 Tax=Candidatus Uhrbacteria bacterium CG_4_10_14_0_8_um_filter_58_22 TaxID=1975029 RepID=A0A2M7QBU4_9BACT|nr:MAG: tRNA (adenosine(37)-N6)-threonylcarbamoyltransferase complex ATPase subunit type 1 TsaE [Candidatus Uhrbacteria bacterium CG_4_10_14_0_8_um_filter_58_22]